MATGASFAEADQLKSVSEAKQLTEWDSNAKPALIPKAGEQQDTDLPLPLQPWLIPAHSTAI